MTGAGAGAAGGLIERENPAHPSQIVGAVAASTPSQVAEAVASASAAWASWAACSVEHRAAAVADAIDHALDDPEGTKATLLCSELGKVRPDCAGELAFSATYAADACARAERIMAPRHLDDDAGRLAVTLHPLGTVAAVTPWNAPIILAMLKVAPALATGNTVVVKPSPTAPLTITAVLEHAAAALPDGVLHVVNGDVATGSALVEHPGVAKVAFTGGGAAGRHIASAAGAHLADTLLELGGNDAAIVCEDAAVDDALAERLALAAFLTSGQVCMAAKRIYVHRSRYDEVVDALQAAAERVLVIGDPMVNGVTVGPVATRDAQRAAVALLQSAVDAGGTVHEVGQQHDSLDPDGYFVQPVIVEGLGDHHPLVADEQFGPLVPVLAFDDEDEAVARANATPFALAGSVWSADEERAFALGARLRCGTVFVNTHNRTGMSLRAPFGGFGASGHGREYGDEGLLEYVAPQAINAPAAFRPGASGGSGSAYPGGDR